MIEVSVSVHREQNRTEHCIQGQLSKILYQQTKQRDVPFSRHTIKNQRTSQFVGSPVSDRDTGNMMAICVSSLVALSVKDPLTAADSL